MTLIDKSGCYIFPRDFIKECIWIYEQQRGKKPKFIVASKEEYDDWLLTSFSGDWGAQRPPTFMGCKITYGLYLKLGQYDFATAINPKTKRNKKK